MGKRINTRPNLGGRQAAQVLVRPDVVVEEAEFTQRLIECRKRFNSKLIELGFERAEEALDTAVLPRAAGIGALMADAEQEQREAKRPGGEDGFIVGSHGAGLAVAVNRLGQLHDQCPARLRFERFQPQRGTARVLEDAEHESRSSIQRGFPGEIECPDEVPWHGFGPRILDLPAHNVDFVSVLAEELRDEGFAHCHAPLRREAPVEAVRDGAAAGLRHESLQADDFLPDPGRLRWCAGKGGWRRGNAPVAKRAPP